MGLPILCSFPCNHVRGNLGLCHSFALSFGCSSVRADGTAVCKELGTCDGMSSVDGGSGCRLRSQRCQLQPCAESQHGGGVQPARLGFAAKWAKSRRKSRPRPHRRPRAKPRQLLSLTFPKTRVPAPWRALASRTSLSRAPVPRAAPLAMLPAEEAGGGQGHRRPCALVAMSFAARGRRSTRKRAWHPNQIGVFGGNSVFGQR